MGQRGGLRQRPESQGIVHGCLPKGITQCSERVITIGARIDENRLASDRQPHGQRVGMAMGRNGKIANRSMVEGQNRGGLTFAPDHRITSRRKRPQPCALYRRRAPLIRKARHECWGPLLVEQGQGGRCNSQPQRRLKQHILARWAWVVAMTRQSSAIADRRYPRLGVHEPQGVLGPGRKPIFGGRRQVVLFSAGNRCDQEQLDRECGIGGRLFCTHSVWVNLAVDFDEQIAPALFAQIGPRRGIPGAIVVPTISPASSAIL